jgi:hypothetical protein
LEAFEVFLFLKKCVYLVEVRPLVGNFLPVQLGKAAQKRSLQRLRGINARTPFLRPPFQGEVWLSFFKNLGSISVCRKNHQMPCWREIKVVPERCFVQVQSSGKGASKASKLYFYTGKASLYSLGRVGTNDVMTMT